MSTVPEDRVVLSVPGEATRRAAVNSATDPVCLGQEEKGGLSQRHIQLILAGGVLVSWLWDKLRARRGRGD